jgi:hypothetical protein
LLSQIASMPSQKWYIFSLSFLPSLNCELRERKGVYTINLFYILF